MAANLITLGRIILTFLTIVLFQGDFYLRITAVLLILFVIYLDAVDGYVARKRNEESDFGALFDITGDRIVEHIFWIFFSAMGLVSIWVPIIYICRSFLVDTLRSVAFAKEGKTPFGEKSMMQSPFTRFLTASRFCRAAYGTAKVAAFSLLGCILAFQKGHTLLYWLSKNDISDLMFLTCIIVWIAVAMNLIRGIPVLWETRHYVFSTK